MKTHKLFLEFYKQQPGTMFDSTLLSNKSLNIGFLLKYSVFIRRYTAYNTNKGMVIQTIKLRKLGFFNTCNIFIN